MDDTTYTDEDKEQVLESHIFTTTRFKCDADAGFSGNVALLVEAIQHSDKVLDENLKILAKGIFCSVINHKILKHTKEEVLACIKAKKEKEEAAKVTELVVEGKCE